MSLPVHLTRGLLAVLLGVACVIGVRAAGGEAPAAPSGTGGAAPPTARAIFAGGCFWCMEPPFDALPGVQATISGYTGGTLAQPTYEQVSGGGTGHAEAIEVRYDPAQVSYEKLLEVFWHNIDPTSGDGQFCDRGHQYRPAIFPLDKAQRAAAEASLAALETGKPFKAPLAVGIEMAGQFYPAEDYHQDYYLKNPIRYKFYRRNCGRDKRLTELWGSAH